MLINEAKALVHERSIAIVLFTHGMFLSYDSLGNGESGNWVIDPEFTDQVDQVIIYLRDDALNTNRIFSGIYSGVKKSPENGRYIVRFSRLQEVGKTDKNWIEFGGGSQNPILYCDSTGS